APPCREAQAHAVNTIRRCAGSMVTMSRSRKSARPRMKGTRGPSTNIHRMVNVHGPTCTVSGPIRVETPPWPTPTTWAGGSDAQVSPTCCASRRGATAQSAPVSIRNIYVRTPTWVWMVTGIVGSLTRPNRVRFSRKGNAIDTHALRRFDILDDEVHT